MLLMTLKRHLLSIRSSSSPCLNIFLMKHHHNGLSIRHFSRPTSGAFLSNKERVRDFLALLNVNEKRILYEELQSQPELMPGPIITVIETSTPPMMDDPTKQLPNTNQLVQLFISQSLPFIGFGFLDNLLMIVAGDYIDLTLGVALGISTMAAAGLGNALSDIAGVGSAYYVERLADKIGVKPPKLSLAQLQMSRTRWITQFGRAFGVAIGCFIGMFPLLFLPHRSDLRNKDDDDDDDEKPKNEQIDH
ncbi:Transmembrane protein 65 [Dermatophagoides farinae]|uniref:Transmembrane protein 65 n=1 Tax=Dermatophagoides farinae TaxID=6954 RepID=A0A922HVC1_DERFA|nr:Transmembrane protein 65 [Dermatophagoides farinae]